MERIKITGRTQSKHSFAIDLIEHTLRDSEQVKVTKDRVIAYEQRRTALRKIWAKHSEEVNKLYAKEAEEK